MPPLHPIHAARAVVGAILVVSLAAPGLSATTDPGDSERSIEDALERIAKEAVEGSNPYLGSAQLDELRASLDELPENDARARWRLLMTIGDHELRLGSTSEALATFEAASCELERFRAKRPQRTETWFKLGLASLRLGEIANCCQRHGPDSCLMPITGGGVHTDTEGSEAALGYFERVLGAARPDSPAAVRSRWLLNIAAMTLGRWPDAVAPELRIDAARFEDDGSFPRFPQEGLEVGLEGAELAGGMAIEDFDGDGWLDVLTSTSDTAGPVRLLVNDRAGHFRPKEDAGLDRQLGGLNMSHADYDGDGDVDVLVLRGAWWRDFGAHPNSLLRNRGDGTFEDVTVAAGLGERAYPTQTAAWADYDNDGDLDLYVGNESPRKPRMPNQLFRNEGDGTFTDVAREAQVLDNRYTKAVAWGDFDNDGWIDLYVSNMAGENRLYRNRGDGTFTDVARTLRVHRPISGFPCWFFDYDNDGRLDLFAAAYGGPKTEPDVADVAASWFGMPVAGEMDRLYRNTSEGFVNVARDLGLDEYTLPMGANFGDVDGDGWLDFFLGTGYPHYEGLMPNRMYRSVDGAAFEDVTFKGGFGHLQKGHGIAFADFDRDGDQDVFQQIGGAYPGDAFVNALWRNPGFGHRWIEVRAVGVESNRSGIGTRVRVTIRDGDGERDVHRTIGSGGSFGCNPLTAWIGLGDAEEVLALELSWPASGRVQRFTDVALDHAYRVREDATELEAVFSTAR